MQHIGYISQKYESGNAGPGTISSGSGDPGGVSYGLYQLASKAGTLTQFIKDMDYTEAFDGMHAATAEFNAKWKQLAEYPQFADDQQAFIIKTHYEPLRAVADHYHIPNTPAIDEMLFSMSVQHGGAAKIVAQMVVTPGMTEKQIITLGYQKRMQYVRKNCSARVADELHARYTKELQDVLKLCQ